MRCLLFPEISFDLVVCFGANVDISDVALDRPLSVVVLLGFVALVTGMVEMTVRVLVVVVVVVGVVVVVVGVVVVVVGVVVVVVVGVVVVVVGVVVVVVGVVVVAIVEGVTVVAVGELVVVVTVIGPVSVVEEVRDPICLPPPSFTEDGGSLVTVVLSVAAVLNSSCTVVVAFVEVVLSVRAIAVVVGDSFVVWGQSPLFIIISSIATVPVLFRDLASNAI